MKKLIEMLHAGDYSCVIVKKSAIHTFRRPGLLDLMNILNTKAHILEGAQVADKVIGKAAAALLILGGVAEVYADVISTQALSLLMEEGIDVSFKQEVPYIQNTAKNDWCLMERLCKEESSPESIHALITDFVEKKRQAQQSA